MAISPRSTSPRRPASAPSAMSAGPMSRRWSGMRSRPSENRLREPDSAAMTPADIILAALFIVLYLVLRFVSRPQFRWTFVSATMVAAIVYAAHVFLGSIVLILSVSRDPQGAAGYFVVFLGWLGF